ncbi:MAG TPA: GNAT family N-acetyltransferase, partial [Casimicrobiaceae bacterium]|nr:GNAT family N-acetyltransferase [Casimicrobiaceae bacterium]
MNAMPDVVVRPIAIGDIEQFRDVTTVVMRERRYLAFIDGFPLDEAATFVARNLQLGNPQWVADDR